jgi:serpin B
MKTRSAVISLLLGSLGGLAACDGGADPTSPIDRLPRTLTVAEQHVARSTVGFGIDLLQRVYGTAEAGNVLLSPLSASAALGMTLNGAVGATYDNMAAALRLEGLSLEEINASYRDLMGLLVDLDPHVQVAIGNSIWYREGRIVLEPDFTSTVRSAFAAEARELDFDAPIATQTINAWVKQATNGRIEEIVKTIPSSIVAYLINAVYFKAPWTEPFDPDDTRPGPFESADGDVTMVPFMKAELPAGVLHNALFTGLDLAYGGGAYRMTILLPDRATGLDGLIEAMDAERWNAWMAAFEESERVSVSMPKYRIEYEKVLNETLVALGMGIAFDGGADFSRMVRGGGVWIDEVKQKTFMEVNEEGTEAAAVTSVSMRDSAPLPVVIDRPFLVAIRERFSGTVLFLGAIHSPEQ